MGEQLKRWKRAKELYKTLVGKKKPSEKYVGIVRKGTGVETAIKDIEKYDKEGPHERHLHQRLLSHDAMMGSIVELKEAGKKYLDKIKTKLKQEDKDLQTDLFKGYKVLTTTLKAIIAYYERRFKDESNRFNAETVAVAKLNEQVRDAAAESKKALVKLNAESCDDVAATMRSVARSLAALEGVCPILANNHAQLLQESERLTSFADVAKGAGHRTEKARAVFYLEKVRENLKAVKVAYQLSA